MNGWCDDGWGCSMLEFICGNFIGWFWDLGVFAIWSVYLFWELNILAVERLPKGFIFL
jgi:hypothetical protein